MATKIVVELGSPSQTEAGISVMEAQKRDEGELKV